MLVNTEIGRQTKRCGMHASHYGTSFCILQRPIARPRFPITISVGDDCLQLLRASLPWATGLVFIISLIAGILVLHMHWQSHGVQGKV
jgi:hypothetical protein